MIIQHPSTPKDMQQPHEIVEQCMAEFFPYVIDTLVDYGYNVNKPEFQKEFRLLVELTRALLLKEKGVSHELQVLFEAGAILNIDDTEN